MVDRLAAEPLTQGMRLSTVKVENAPSPAAFARIGGIGCDGLYSGRTRPVWSFLLVSVTPAKAAPERGQHRQEDGHEATLASAGSIDASRCVSAQFCSSVLVCCMALADTLFVACARRARKGHCCSTTPRRRCCSVCVPSSRARLRHRDVNAAVRNDISSLQQELDAVNADIRAGT